MRRFTFLRLAVVLAIMPAGCAASREGGTSDIARPTATTSGSAAPSATNEAASDELRAQVRPAIDFQIPASRRGVFIFSKTAGFRHDSIPEGIACLKRICRKERLDPDATEDASKFTDEILKGYDVVVFLNTTGDVLNDEQQAVLERFVRSGGGFVGIHSAADTEYDWPWYGELVGARFKSHPVIQEASIDVLDASHPATSHLPERWTRTDEWYDFQASPRDGPRRLLSLDETTYQDGRMGKNHPIAWCHDFEGGRAFYTACGHTKESYADPLMVEHLRGAILWVMELRKKAASAESSQEADMHQTTSP